MLPFTLQQFQILRAIANEKSFTKASKLLYLSQPALSKQIKMLEKNLNVVLINRENNRTFLTENGEILLKYSERILALCEESYRTLIDIKNSERANLTIGASPTVGIYLLPSLLTLFAQKYPQIRLKMAVNSPNDLARNIFSKKIAIALVSDENVKGYKKNLTVEDFVYDELSLVASKSHSLAKKTNISKKDLYYLSFITLNSNNPIKKSINYTLFQNQIEPQRLKTILQLDSIEGIKTAVNLGLGVTFISSLSIEKELKLNTIKIIKIDNVKMTQNILIVSNSDYYKSKAFELFYTQLLELKKELKNPNTTVKELTS